MSLFEKIFQSNAKVCQGGFDVFLLGRKLYDDSVLNTTLSSTRKTQKKMAALEFFDQAIENFSKAIEQRPDVAQYYSVRAWIKAKLYDHEGGLLDACEAIRVCAIENEDNDYWDSFAKRTGYGRNKRKVVGIQDKGQVRAELETLRSKITDGDILAQHSMTFQLTRPRNYPM
jgi:tetratricopeptide (TPR) repeat protein